MDIGPPSACVGLTGDTRKIFVSNIKTVVDESNSARVLVGCKPIKVSDDIYNTHMWEHTKMNGNNSQTLLFTGLKVKFNATDIINIITDIIIHAIIGLQRERHVLK